MTIKMFIRNYKKYKVLLKPIINTSLSMIIGSAFLIPLSQSNIPYSINTKSLKVTDTIINPEITTNGLEVTAPISNKPISDFIDSSETNNPDPYNLLKEWLENNKDKIFQNITNDQNPEAPIVSSIKSLKNIHKDVGLRNQEKLNVDIILDFGWVQGNWTSDVEVSGIKLFGFAIDNSSQPNPTGPTQVKPEINISNLNIPFLTNKNYPIDIVDIDDTHETAEITKKLQDAVIVDINNNPDNYFINPAQADETNSIIDPNTLVTFSIPKDQTDKVNIHLKYLSNQESGLKEYVEGNIILSGFNTAKTIIATSVDATPELAKLRPGSLVKTTPELVAFINDKKVLSQIFSNVPEKFFAANKDILINSVTGSNGENKASILFDAKSLVLTSNPISYGTRENISLDIINFSRKLFPTKPKQDLLIADLDVDTINALNYNIDFIQQDPSIKKLTPFAQKIIDDINLFPNKYFTSVPSIFDDRPFVNPDVPIDIQMNGDDGIDISFSHLTNPATSIEPVEYSTEKSTITIFGFNIKETNIKQKIEAEGFSIADTILTELVPTDVNASQVEEILRSEKILSEIFENYPDIFLKYNAKNLLVTIDSADASSINITIKVKYAKLKKGYAIDQLVDKKIKLVGFVSAEPGSTIIKATSLEKLGLLDLEQYYSIDFIEGSKSQELKQIIIDDMMANPQKYYLNGNVPTPDQIGGNEIFSDIVINLDSIKTQLKVSLVFIKTTGEGSPGITSNGSFTISGFNTKDTEINPIYANGINIKELFGLLPSQITPDSEGYNKILQELNKIKATGLFINYPNKFIEANQQLIFEIVKPNDDAGNLEISITIKFAFANNEVLDTKKFNFIIKGFNQNLETVPKIDITASLLATIDAESNIKWNEKYAPDLITYSEKYITLLTKLINSYPNVFFDGYDQSTNPSTKPMVKNGTIKINNYQKANEIEIVGEFLQAKVPSGVTTPYYQEMKLIITGFNTKPTKVSSGLSVSTIIPVDNGSLSTNQALQELLKKKVEVVKLVNDNLSILFPSTNGTITDGIQQLIDTKSLANTNNLEIISLENKILLKVLELPVGNEKGDVVIDALIIPITDNFSPSKPTTIVKNQVIKYGDEQGIFNQIFPNDKGFGVDWLEKNNLIKYQEKLKLYINKNIPYFFDTPSSTEVKNVSMTINEDCTVVVGLTFSGLNEGVEDNNMYNNTSLFIQLRQTPNQNDFSDFNDALNQMVKKLSIFPKTLDQIKLLIVDYLNSKLNDIPNLAIPENGFTISNINDNGLISIENDVINILPGVSFGNIISISLPSAIIQNLVIQDDLSWIMYLLIGATTSLVVSLMILILVFFISNMRKSQVS